MNIGIVKAGHALNALPALAEASIFFRVVDNAKELLERVRSIVADRATIDEVASSPPVQLQTLEGYDSQIVSFNTDIPYFDYDPNYTDVFLFGPGSITDAHSEWEFIRINDIHKAIDVYCDLAIKKLTK